MIPPWPFCSRSADDQEIAAITAAGMGGWPGLVCFVIRVQNSFLLCSSSSAHNPLRSEQVQNDTGVLLSHCVINFKQETGEREQKLKGIWVLGVQLPCISSAG